MIILERDGSVHCHDWRRRPSDEPNIHDHDHAKASLASENPSLFQRLLGLTVGLFRHDDLEGDSEEE